jgi:hypothetical protein
MTLDKKITFRLSAEILAKLSKSAKENQRSVSAEIIYRLLKSFKRGE